MSSCLEPKSRRWNGRTLNPEHPEVCQDRLVKGMRVRGMANLPLTLIPLSRVPPCSWKIFAEYDEVARWHYKRKGFGRCRIRVLFHRLGAGIASHQSVSVISFYAPFVTFCGNRTAAFRLKFSWFPGFLIKTPGLMRSKII